MTSQIEDLSINRRVIDLLHSFGIKKLFPTQDSALKSGVLEGKNLVLAVPTSSGKTLVAEISMLKSILDGLGKALYLVPLRSLASEKYEEFRRYEKIGITIAMSVGDYDSSGTSLKDADIIILTTERADSLIRHQVDWLNDIGIVVIDEIHLVNDTSRGPTLEMVLAKLRRLRGDVQIVALSATISNADDIAGWLNAQLVKSEWRPIPLREGVYLDGSIDFEDNSSRSIKRKRREELADIVCDILDEDGQVLVFVSSRRSTISMAKRIAASLRPYLNEAALEILEKVGKRIAASHSAPKITKTLAEVMSRGAAFHHAGLTNQERSLIEEHFKKNHLKVIVATPTLAAGVNLPARRVIVRDYRRFEPSRGNYPIPILEYKQMAGRAGRPKYDDYGEAILVARSPQEKDFLLENYILSEPEDILSKLASQTAIRSHLLSTIASNLTRNREEIDHLIDGTFYSYQFEKWEIEHHISSALSFLEEGELIESVDDDSIIATALGERTSRLYIDPHTAILFRNALTENESFSEIGLLHLLCHSPDQPVTYVTKTEFENYDYLVHSFEDLLVPIPDSWEDPEAYSRFLGEIKTARLLSYWLSERTEKEITDEFNVGMGDVQRYTQSAEWLMYSITEVSRVIGASHHLSQLNTYRQRMKYGVHPELLELVSIKGIGRVRGRMLYNHDLKSISDLYRVPLETMARIPTIGTSIAASIKRQLGIEVSDDEISIAVSAEPDDDLALQTLLEDFEQ